MIPPVAPTLLASNPKFEKVHQHLTKNVLAVDASTRTINASHEAISAQLDARRVQEAEDRILSASLFELCGSAELPLELRDLVLIIGSYISDTGKLGLTEKDHGLMKDDADILRSRIGEIANALSQSLMLQYDTLTSVASTASDSASASQIPTRDARHLSSTFRSDSSDLKSLVQTLTSDIQHLRRQAVPSAQYDASNVLSTVLKSQAQYLQHLIRHLEQRKHGAEARHLVARAQFLSTVAQGLDAKSKATYLEQRRDVYSPQLRQELADRMGQLEEEEEMIAQRRRSVQAALHEYDVVGGDVMRTLGKRYGDIEKDLEEVKKDVEHLRKQRGAERDTGKVP
jgi:hypothetical protein